jgi:hypothetical protein
MMGRHTLDSKKTPFSQLPDDHHDSVATKEAEKKSTSVLGKGIAWLYCIGYSLVITVFFSYLGMLAGLDDLWGLGKGPLIAVLAAVLGIEIYIHRNIYLTSVPAIFTLQFWRDAFSSKHSLGKRLFCSVGLLLALAGGLALGALTYNKAFDATTAIIKVVGTFLGFAGLSFPPLGIGIGALLAPAAFFAFTGLIFKWVVKIAHEGYFNGVIKFFRDMYYGQEGKSLTQTRLEGLFKFIAVAGMLTCAVFGMIATLGTVQVGLETFFVNRHIDAAASKLASYIIVYGGMAVTRMFWALHSVAHAIGSVVNWICARIDNYRQGISSPIEVKKIGRNLIEVAAHGFIYHPFTAHGDFAVHPLIGGDVHIAENVAKCSGAGLAGGVGVYGIQQHATMFAHKTTKVTPEDDPTIKVEPSSEFTEKGAPPLP